MLIKKRKLIITFPGKIRTNYELNELIENVDIRFIKIR
jgi:hypothetical protein